MPGPPLTTLMAMVFTSVVLPLPVGPVKTQVPRSPCNFSVSRGKPGMGMPSPNGLPLVSWRNASTSSLVAVVMVDGFTSSIVHGRARTSGRERASWVRGFSRALASALRMVAATSLGARPVASPAACSSSRTNSRSSWLLSASWNRLNAERFNWSLRPPSPVDRMRLISSRRAVAPYPWPLTARTSWVGAVVGGGALRFQPQRAASSSTRPASSSHPMVVMRARSTGGVVSSHSTTSPLLGWIDPTNMV